MCACGIINTLWSSHWLTVTDVYVSNVNLWPTAGRGGAIIDSNFQRTASTNRLNRFVYKWPTKATFVLQWLLKSLTQLLLTFSENTAFTNVFVCNHIMKAFKAIPITAQDSAHAKLFNEHIELTALVFCPVLLDSRTLAQVAGGNLDPTRGGLVCWLGWGWSLVRHIPLASRRPISFRKWKA